VSRYRRSLEAYRRALELIPDGSQTMSKRPTQFAPGQYPIYASHGRGGRVWDVDGNEYVDLVMALGPITLGYCYPAVDDAVRAQLERGIVYGLLAEVELAAAEAVVSAVPCAEMVRFFKGGADATSAAVRIARAFTGREKVATCGYRGWHDQWNTHRNDGGIPAALAAYTLPFTYDDLGSLERVLAANRGEVAAVFLDPVASVAPSAGFLAGVKELARAHGALLIFDEIVTGFRLALGGAQEHFGVTPDLACFAKGIANGMPLAAVCGRRDVMRTIERLIVSVTYGGEALSLAAAVAAIREYRERRVFDHIWRIGRRLSDALNAAADEVGVPFRCGGLAPMGAMEFQLPAELASAAWTFFLQESARRGVLFRRGGLNFVTFSHTEADVDAAAAAAREALAALREHLDRGTLAEAVAARAPEGPAIGAAGGHRAGR
jgi:glutamate-1-semialdehyde aminotransferase